MPRKLDLKPPFKWVGGKRRALKFLEPFIMPFPGTYCEPFLGGGAMFLATQPKKAFLTDANQDVIDAWECISDNVDMLTEELHALINVHEVTKKFYLAKRAEFNELKQIHISNITEYQFVRRSALFMFLLKMCFNGVYTLTKANEFKGGIGDRTKFTYDIVNLREISKYLNNNEIKFGCMDYKEAMSLYNDDSNDGRGSYWFIDPPYHTSVKFYNSKPFTEVDQLELACWCDYLKNARHCILVITNRNTEFIRKLYPSFSFKFYDIQVAVSADPKNRVEKQEILIHNIPSN